MYHVEAQCGSGGLPCPPYEQSSRTQLCGMYHGHKIDMSAFLGVLILEQQNFLVTSSTHLHKVRLRYTVCFWILQCFFYFCMTTVILRCCDCCK